MRECIIIGGEFGKLNNRSYEDYKKFLHNFILNNNIKTIILNKSDFSIVTANILSEFKNNNFKIKFVTIEEKFKDKVVKNLFKELFDKIVVYKFKDEANLIKNEIKKAKFCLFFNNNNKEINDYKNYAKSLNKEIILLQEIFNNKI